jgi:alkanesulfonate monooxygenase SsuD/methylene tetrahydromethanopterin reductase-like flavin-dependent oxidoreductase (luciferase family)
MRALWTQEKPSFQGKYVSFRDIEFQPRPVQEPLSIIIGGGTQKTLERAAALGDGWHPLGKTWATLTKDVAELKRLLAARGRSIEGFPMGYTLYYTGAASQTQRHTSLAGGEEASSLSMDIGEAREQVARLRELGIGYITLRFRGMTHTELCSAMRAFAKDVLPKIA